jgi:hypothetical protein
MCLIYYAFRRFGRIFITFLLLRYTFLKKSHFVYPPGKPMIPHLLRYQGLAVEDYSFALAALS